MLKYSLIYLCLSILTVLLAAYFKFVLVYLHLIYAYVNKALEPLFGTGFMGDLLRDVLMLTLTPLALASIPMCLYWLIKRKKMPYFMELTWLLWLILAMSNYLIY